MHNASALIIPVRITSGGRNSEWELETGTSEQRFSGVEKKGKNLPANTR